VTTPSSDISGSPSITATAVSEGKSISVTQVMTLPDDAAAYRHLIIADPQPAAGRPAVRTSHFYRAAWNADRDCNPGLEFSIPEFGIVEFSIPGSRDPVGIGVV